MQQLSPGSGSGATIDSPPSLIVSTFDTENLPWPRQVILIPRGSVMRGCLRFSIPIPRLDPPGVSKIPAVSGKLYSHFELLRVTARDTDDAALLHPLGSLVYEKQFLPSDDGGFHDQQGARLACVEHGFSSKKVQTLPVSVNPNVRRKGTPVTSTAFCGHFGGVCSQATGAFKRLCFRSASKIWLMDFASFRASQVIFA